MYNQQKKKIVGTFGPILIPSEDDSIECEDLSDSDAEEEQGIQQKVATRSLQNNGNMCDLKKKILKGHVLSATQKSSVDIHNKTISNGDYSRKFSDLQASTKSQLEKGSLGDFSDLTQSIDLFSRVTLQKTYH